MRWFEEKVLRATSFNLHTGSNAKNDFEFQTKIIMLKKSIKMYLIFFIVYYKLG